jgi:hypothetical protein
MFKTKLTFCLIFAVLALGLNGCHRDEENFDNRTLEKMPVTETPNPVDRKDPFRP